MVMAEEGDLQGEHYGNLDFSLGTGVQFYDSISAGNQAQLQCPTDLMRSLKEFRQLMWLEFTRQTSLEDETEQKGEGELHKFIQGDSDL
jgi:hypothetical protein